MTKKKLNENPFEYATRTKFRFPSSKGELNIEQLWDVPLRSRDDFNLDNIAKRINADLKKVSEESFVDGAARNPAHEMTEIKLDVVKAVIAFHLDEEERREKKAKAKSEREKLYAELEKRQDARYENMSDSEIKKKLAAIDALDD